MIGKFTFSENDLDINDSSVFQWQRKIILRLSK